MGENESSNISRSMFSINAKILHCAMKNQIVHTVERSVPETIMSKRGLIDNTDISC